MKLINNLNNYLLNYAFDGMCSYMELFEGIDPP